MLKFYRSNEGTDSPRICLNLAKLGESAKGGPAGSERSRELEVPDARGGHRLARRALRNPDEGPGLFSFDKMFVTTLANVCHLKNYEVYEYRV